MKLLTELISISHRHMHHGPVQIHEISVEMLSTNFVTIRMSELSYMGILSPHCSYSQCTTHIGMCINSSLSSMTWNYFRSKCWWIINIAFICWKNISKWKIFWLQSFLYRYNYIFSINGEYVSLFHGANFICFYNLKHRLVYSTIAVDT
jgi:hypothetical protein